MAEVPEVRIRQLAKRFPVRRSWSATLRQPARREWVTVLRGVSLEVNAGEFFGLLGPNGAGKTTLFKVLGTFVLPDEGEVFVGGIDVVRAPGLVRTRLATAIPEERSLFWRLSARENLRCYAALQGLRGSAMRERVEELLHLVELANAGEKMVAQFSSGMKQRLLVARALLGRPRILLLDEPTRSLDPLSARRFRTFLREQVANRHGCTVLLATHNAEEALNLCDRIAILNLGRLLRVGTPAALLREMGDERYRITVPRAEVERFRARFPEEALVEVVAGDESSRDWASIQFPLPGGASAAAGLIEDLVRRGIPVSGLEPVHLTLAELIERVVDRGSSSEGSGK